MNILDLSLPPSPVTVAVDDIARVLSELRDSSGTQIFGANVIRGLEQEKRTPAADETPACHIWVGEPKWAFESVQAYTLRIEAVAELYLFVYCDETERRADYARAADDLCLYVSQAFFHPRICVDPKNNPGMDFENKWRGWQVPQVVIMPSTNPLSKFNGAYTAGPNWIVRAIHLNFFTMGEVRP